MTPILGYWDIRGFGEPIRYLLHYVGANFEDKRYYTREAWTDEKYQLGLDFPNLPYYIDEKVKLTQSTTILRYLARKHNLAGSTEEEKVRLELLEQQFCDFRFKLNSTAYDPNYENLKDDLIKSIPPQLQLFSNYLGDKTWFNGDTLTYVDFMAYDTLDFHWMYIPTIMNDYPNLKQYILRFENHPPLQSYLKFGKHKRWPIFRAIGPFGGTGTEPQRQ